MNLSQPKSRRIEISESIPTAKEVFWSAVILVGFVALLFFAYRVFRELRPPEYEGKIIDKWAGYHHSDLGSSPYFRLHLETKDGHRSTVAVDQQTYNRAKVGMWIRKTRGGIELSQVVVPKVVSASIRRITGTNTKTQSRLVRSRRSSLLLIVVLRRCNSVLTTG